MMSQALKPSAASDSHKHYDDSVQRHRTLIVAALFAALTLLFALVPLFSNNLSLAFYLMLWVVMASGMNLCVGFTGYFPFGYVAFYGIGAYATGICYKVLGLPVLPSLAVAGLCGVVLALIMAPTLRLKGVYFSIVNLALATILQLVITNLPEQFTGGSMGIILASANNPTHSYYAMLLVMTAILSLALWLSVSYLGKALKSIRNDDLAAACLGINVPVARLKIWLLSAIFPALVGGVEAWYTNAVDPEYAFDVMITAKSIIYGMAGGFGTIIGPVVGSLMLVGVDNLMWARFPSINLLLLGLIIILLMLFLPRGLIGSWLKRYPRLRRYIA